MAFFKRVEVWVLLVLTIGGVVAVLRMDQSDDGSHGGRSKNLQTSPTNDDSSPGRGSAKQQAQTRHQLAAVQIERDGDYAVLEIRLSSPALQGSAKAPLAKPRLLRADGSEVAEFFVPSAARPPAAASSREWLFWADRNTLSGELFLEIDGEKLKVKEADGFRLDDVADGSRKIIVGQLPQPRLPTMHHAGIAIVSCTC